MISASWLKSDRNRNVNLKPRISPSFSILVIVLNMAARNRNRQSMASDINEENALWTSTMQELRRLPELYSNAAKIAQEANDIQHSLDLIMDLNTVRKLEDVYMEGIDIAETEQLILNQAQESLDILIALRQATEMGTGALEMKRKKRKAEDTVIEIPVTKHKKQRSASIADTIVVGSQVAYRPKHKAAEGDWIQCTVLRLYGEGVKLRYEIQDIEPDLENPEKKYKATASNCILIPPEGQHLPALRPGTTVLARYPETTTFYRAEFIGMKRDGVFCRLRFEGEEEAGKETEVERRLVIEAPTRG